MDLKNGGGSCGQGASPGGDPDCTMTLNAETFGEMFAGKLNPTSAFMSGKLKIKGDLPLAMKLEKLMKKMMAANTPSSPGAGPMTTFTKIHDALNEELVKSIGGVFTFDLKGNGLHCFVYYYFKVQS